MLPQDLKTDVLEIAEIAKACPDNLQERCFELLLSRYLEGLPTPTTPTKVKEKTPPPPAESQQEQSQQSENTVVNGGGGGTEQDLTLADLHVKTRKFLEKYGRSVTDLNQLFYKENRELKPLYEDLKTTKLLKVRYGLLFLQR